MWRLIMMKELLIVVIDWIDEYLIRSDVDIDVDVDVDVDVIAWLVVKNCMYNYVNCYN